MENKKVKISSLKGFINKFLILKDLIGFLCACISIIFLVLAIRQVTSITILMWIFFGGTVFASVLIWWFDNFSLKSQINWIINLPKNIKKSKYFSKKNKNEK